MRSAIVDAHLGDLFAASVGVVQPQRETVRECWINVRVGFFGRRLHDVFISRNGAIYAERIAKQMRSAPVLYRIHVRPK